MTSARRLVAVLTLIGATTACSGHERTTSAAGARSSQFESPTVSGYRLVRPPLAVVDQVGGGMPSFRIYFRLNRRPRGKNAVLARLADASQPPEGAVSFSSRDPACLLQEFNATRRATSLRRLRPGDEARLRIKIAKVTQPLVVPVTLIAPLAPDSGTPPVDEGAPYARRLGCR